MSVSKKVVKKLELFGYTKKEDGRFVSICVNLSLFAQGKTPEEAFQKLLTEVKVYLDYVAEKHFDEWDAYTNRVSAPDIVEEYMTVWKDASELARRAVENVKNKDYRKYLGSYPFVHPISTPYTQAGMQNT